MPIDPAVLLRQRGLRVTAQRVAVLRAVLDEPHVTADAVVETARTQLGSISVQSVYSALAALTERGILRRIQAAGSPARYENRFGDDYRHFVCRTCDRMVDVGCAVGDSPWPPALADLGYRIDDVEVIYWGRCPECAAGHPVSAQASVAR